MTSPRQNHLATTQGVIAVLVLLATIASAQLPSGPRHSTKIEARRHNVIFFVPDGLRASSVDPQHAPALAQVAERGVTFTDTHSLFPTLTTPNASAFATGHLLGDTGDFSNTIYTRFPLRSLQDTTTPFLEDDSVLNEIDDHFGGNFLDEASILASARAAGYATAAIGKIGPAALQDLSALDDRGTILIDDATGSAKGVPLAPHVVALLRDANVPLMTPGRGDNGKSGTDHIPGTHSADIAQARYFADVATRAILPYFARTQQPFAMVYWSRDPDGTQHNQGDSLHRLTPGINGPTSLAAIRNADHQLAQLRASLKVLGLDATTDIVVAADHGFSTISKESKTSYAASLIIPGVTKGDLPPDFVAIDLAHGLGLHAYDATPPYIPMTLADGHFPKFGSILIGPDPLHARMVVVANGGSDLLYLLGNEPRDQQLMIQIVEVLAKQDYTSGLYTDDRFGPIRGALSMSRINLSGSAIMPHPALALSFRSYSSGCHEPIRCGIEIADTGLQQGQGMHGGFTRSDTQNFVAAIGPDFKAHYTDNLPVSNADVGMTIAHLLGLHLPPNGHHIGRILNETLVYQTPNAPTGIPQHFIISSSPTNDGTVTQLREEYYAGEHYLDAAGFPYRTLGL